jgi:hypothetical protein
MPVSISLILDPTAPIGDFGQAIVPYRSNPCRLLRRNYTAVFAALQPYTNLTGLSPIK